MASLSRPIITVPQIPVNRICSFAGCHSRAVVFGEEIFHCCTHSPHLTPNHHGVAVEGRPLLARFTARAFASRPHRASIAYTTLGSVARGRQMAKA